MSSAQDIAIGICMQLLCVCYVFVDLCFDVYDMNAWKIDWWVRKLMKRVIYSHHNMQDSRQDSILHIHCSVYVHRQLGGSLRQGGGIVSHT